MSPTSESESREALAEIQEANRQMAERAKAPGYYHWTLGLLTGGMAAVQELPYPWMAAYYPIFGAGLFLLVRSYKRHTGMWIYGYRRGRTRVVAICGAIVAALLMMGGVWLKRMAGLDGACVAAGVLVAIEVTLLGHLWEMAYRRDLGVA
jgi:hypothetical protein